MDAIRKYIQAIPSGPVDEENHHRLIGQKAALRHAMTGALRSDEATQGLNIVSSSCWDRSFGATYLSEHP